MSRHQPPAARSTGRSEQGGSESSAVLLPLGEVIREGILMFFLGGETDFRPGAGTEQQPTGRADSHTETSSKNNAQRNRRGKRAHGVLIFFQELGEIKRSIRSEDKKLL